MIRLYDDMDWSRMRLMVKTLLRVLGGLVALGCQPDARSLEFASYPPGRDPCGPWERRGRVLYTIDTNRDRLVPPPAPIRHTLGNCTTKPLWINNRFRVWSPRCARLGAEIVQTATDDSGAEPRSACIPLYSPRAGSQDYELVAPGKTLEAFRWEFHGYEPMASRRYRLRATFHDANAAPPPAPAGAELFRGPVESNELTVQSPATVGVP